MRDDALADRLSEMDGEAGDLPRHVNNCGYRFRLLYAAISALTVRQARFEWKVLIGFGMLAVLILFGREKGLELLKLFGVVLS